MKKYSTLIAILIIILIAIFFRFRNLNEPSQFLFDEDLYVYTAQLMLQGNKKAFEWWHPPDTTSESQYQYRPPAVEWLHPPLSKYAIVKSIAIFGDQPWVWRLPSAVGGVSLVLAIGWLAQALFDRKSITLLAMGIAAVESILIVQSRLASADVFVALFTTAALASFVQWQMKNWRWGMPLAGILAGLAMASKWSGGLIILAMVALLIVDYFLKQHFLSTKPSDYNKRHPELTSNSAVTLSRFNRDQDHLKKNNITTTEPGSNNYARHAVPIKSGSASSTSIKQLIIALSTLILIPIIVYLITYLPALSLGHTPSYVLELHRQAWQYQSTNRTFHPNSSPAYMWLFNQKPVWYYFNEVTSKSIVAKGSYFVMGGGLICLGLSLLSVLSMLHLLPKKWPPLAFITQLQPYPHLVLLITFLSLWTPWLLVQRPTFLYHYLPCIPILIVVLSFWIIHVVRKKFTSYK